MHPMSEGRWQVYDSVNQTFMDSYFSSYADAMGWITSQFGANQTQFTVAWVPHA